MRTDIVRQERKYYLTLVQASRCESYFRWYLQPDRHNGPRGYLIRSLYFDTPDNQDYHDKLNGYAQRRKIRLRTYSADADSAFLELKQKDAHGQRKRSLQLPRAEAVRLAGGDYAPLLEHGEAFASEVYALLQTRCYQPRAVIQYYRTAYTSPVNEIRVTFDREISATESNHDLFAQPWLGAPVLAPFHAILEIKYNHFLPAYLNRPLASCDGRQISISKYCLGRAISMHYYPYL